MASQLERQFGNFHCAGARFEVTAFRWKHALEFSRCAAQQFQKWHFRGEIKAQVASYFLAIFRRTYQIFVKSDTFSVKQSLNFKNFQSCRSSWSSKITWLWKKPGGVWTKFCSSEIFTPMNLMFHSFASLSPTKIYPQENKIWVSTSVIFAKWTKLLAHLAASEAMEIFSLG